jgi:hypothetical protein
MTHVEQVQRGDDLMESEKCVPHLGTTIARML